MKEKKSPILSRYFFFLFLLSYPLSVSVSQSAFILSFLFFSIDLISRSLPTTHSQKRVKNLRIFFPPVFWASFLIYGGVFLSSLFQNVSFWWDGDFWKQFSGGETSDFWMTFGIPLGIYHFKNRTINKRLLFFVFLGIFLHLFSGVISLFTPYRLARFIQNGFHWMEGDRLQHFAGSMFGVGMYLPIGLQATHLTYGGILGVGATGILYWGMKNFLTIGKMEKITLLSIAFISFLLLLINQSRSVWLGVLFFLVLVILVGLKERIFGKKISLSKIFSSKILLLVFILSGIGIFTAKKIYDSNWLVQRAVYDLTQKKSTENQRYFIFKNSFSVLKKHFLWGVGNNQFSTEWKKEAESMIKEREWLWYELEITPNSHAHHDFLHFWIAGGAISGIAWLIFWGLILRQGISFLSNAHLGHKDYPIQRHHKKSYNNLALLGIGVIVLLPAGFFQCYILDDEVALPFYSFVGILFSFQKRELSHKTIGSFLLALSLTGAGLLFWKVRTDLPPEEVHLRKEILSSANPQERILYMEGCLTHRFLPTPPQKEDRKFSKKEYIAISYPPRVQPFRGKLIFADANSRKNYPQKIILRIIDRDSFDQDKLYRAHEKKSIREISFPISESLTEFSWEDARTLPDSSSDSKGFPGSVRFRDFEWVFQYNSNADNPAIPEVKMSLLCGLNED